MSMLDIENRGSFLLGRLDGAKLTESDREALLAMANEDTEEELLELMDEADRFAEPLVYFGVCPVASDGSVNGVATGSQLVEERLQGKSRAFPYIATCGPRLEKWSESYQQDYLLGFWADEIKKKFLNQIAVAFRAHLKKHYRTAGHLAALNPGSLKGWPINGQATLFQMLGGREAVRDAIGVTYSDSFLMFPTKTISGLSFESESFYENCQYCPLDKCPNRRAKRLTEV